MPYADPEKQRECMAAYLKTPKGKRDHNKATKSWRQRNPEKYRAQNAVGNALRDGKLVRPEKCEDCGIECKPHGHHEDYSKPLAVNWVCKPCHDKRHRQP